MLHTPVRLSDCGSLLVLDDTPGDRYQIRLDAANPLVLRAGTLAGSPSAQFRHPHLVTSVPAIYEVKRSSSDGRKSWTSYAGITHLLRIPHTAIQLLPERGYSDIPAMINGVRVILSVSGGTIPDGWEDRLRSPVSIAIGHRIRDLQRLGDAALPGPHPPVPTPPFSPEQAAHWALLAAGTTRALKTTIYDRITAGARPTIQLRSETAPDGVTGSIGVNLIQSPHARRVRTIIVQANGRYYGVPPTQVNWLRTAQTNSLPTPAFPTSGDPHAA